MKPVSSNCPNCGAPLPQSDSSKDIFCAYCGTQIFRPSKKRRMLMNQPEKKKFVLKLLMWLGIVVAYFIISGLCWAVRA